MVNLFRLEGIAMYHFGGSSTSAKIFTYNILYGHQVNLMALVVLLQM